MDDVHAPARDARGPALFSVSLYPARFPLALVLMALALTAAHIVTDKARASLDPGLVRFLDLNEEANLPAWFSSGLWLVAGLFALAVFQRQRARSDPYAAYWLGMVILFLLLSLDEAGKLHETIGTLLGRRVEGQAALEYTYAWVFFGLALFAIVGIAYLRFLLRLRREVALLLVLSSGLFLLGAVVFESLGAMIDSGKLRRLDLWEYWPWIVVGEELLEMAGVILLVYVLLRVLSLEDTPYRVHPPSAVSAGTR
jgi:hypothetical protein